MKGGKKRLPQEPSLLTPPQVTAVDAVGEKSRNEQENPSPSPFLNSTPKEGPMPHNQRNLVEEAASVATEVRRAAVAEGKRPIVEEKDGGGNEGGDVEDLRMGGGDVEDTDEEAEAEEKGDGEAETPKLAEGYYEIEAVRKKRVRKGQVQYLIKWRGWPETANTWEPFDNLSSVSDVIDAFEESLPSGKKSARRRKRKSGSASTQGKKKQQQSSSSPAAATYGVPARKYRLTEGPITPPVNDKAVGNTDEADAGGSTGTELATQVTEKPVSSRTEEVAEEQKTELNLELRESAAVHETYVEEAPVLETCGVANGLLNADGAGPVHSGRSTGSKRRKTGSIRRFKQEAPTSTQSTAAENGSCGVTENQGIQVPGIMDNDSGITIKTDNSMDICAITEIVRPISYSTSISNNSQNVSLTFKAKRSDGKEVTVDNKFLKANNPLLLVNYYEQHLRYNNATE